jgi:hypothetical protein
MFEVREGRIQLGHCLIRPHCPFTTAGCFTLFVEVNGFEVSMSGFVALSAALDGEQLLY